MFSLDLIREDDFHIACVREADGADVIDRWATADDRARSALRPRSGTSSLLAVAALRSLLFMMTARSDWILHCAISGKPSIKTPGGIDGPSVSLSHTAGLIAVAVAVVQGGMIGVDVERHRPRNFDALAEHAFGAAERREVALGGREAFYRIWTLREAIAKATGEGLSLVVNRVDLANGIGGVRLTNRMQSMQDWRLLHIQPEPGCSLACALLGLRGEAVCVAR